MGAACSNDLDQALGTVSTARRQFAETTAKADAVLAETEALATDVSQAKEQLNVRAQRLQVAATQ